MRRQNAQRRLTPRSKEEPKHARDFCTLALKISWLHTVLKYRRYAKLRMGVSRLPDFAFLYASRKRAATISIKKKKRRPRYSLTENQYIFSIKKVRAALFTGSGDAALPPPPLDIIIQFMF